MSRLLDHSSAQLLSVFAGIVLVGLPFASLVTVPIAAAMAIVSGWVLMMVFAGRRPPGKIVRAMMAFAVMALIIHSYGSVFGLVPGTVMVLMLCAMKLFELKGKRDISLVIFLCLFITASNFFHSQSFWIALYMFMIVTYLISLLVLINDRLHSTDVPLRLRMSLKFIALAMPLMLILFVTFPRLPHPLWTVPDNSHSARTGIPDEISPGSIAELIESSAVAFRVKFDGAVPDNKDLYWRGIVLSDFDGETWRRGYVPYFAYPNMFIEKGSGGRYAYTVTQQPTRQNWLYTLESLAGYQGGYRLDRELRLTTEEPIDDVIQYQLTSSTQAINAGMFEQERIKYMQLPADSNPRSMLYARQKVQAAAGNKLRYVREILNGFNQQEFFYTLQPPALDDDVVDGFLFDSRRGFCEHYASAFAFLMRAGGIPARVIIGYQGGEMHPQDEYMIVRQSDAHAWVEIWVHEKWIRIDSTAAVAPDRIERGLRYAGLETDYLPTMMLVENALLKTLMYRWDSFQYKWNQWVIGFDAVKQKLLFKNLGFGDMSTTDMAVTLIILASVVLGLTMIWLLYFNQPRKDRVQRVYDQFCDKLAKSGQVKSRYEGASDYARRISDDFPAAAEEVEDITRHYLGLRYGADSSKQELMAFVRSVRRFRLTRA